MYEITTQVTQADGTIHASKTTVPAKDLTKVLGIQRSQAGDKLVSQEVYPR